MKIISVLLFIFLSNGLHAQDTVVKQWRIIPSLNDSVNAYLFTEATNVSMETFYQDTLRNDSFLKSNFSTYLLPKKQLFHEEGNYYSAHNTIQIKHIYRRDWVFLVVVGILMLFLFIKFNFSKLYRNALSSLYKSSATAELIKDKYSPRWLFVLFTNLFFVLIVSLWAYRNFIRLEEPLFEEKFDVFLSILGLVLLVYVFKFLIHMIAGVIFQVSDAISMFVITISITNLFCGVSLLFATLLLLYSPWHGQPWLIDISLGIIVFFFMLRYVLGLLQTVQYFKYDYFYLILYLCTLEIAPWFLIITYLNNYL